MGALYTGDPHTILRKVHHGYFEERVAAAALSPGHFLEVTSADKFQKHSTQGGRKERWFAYEDAKQGKTINDAYAQDDRVFAYNAMNGDYIRAKVPANAVAIAKGDPVMSNGAGCLIKLVDAEQGGNLLYSNVAASAAHTNTTTEALFDKNYSLPANFLKAGDVIRVRAQVIATVTNSTDTLTLVLYLGGLTGIAIVTTGAVDVANGDIGYIEADIVIRTIGATGTLVASGVQALGVPGTVTAKPFLKAETAVNTTTALVIGVGADWSVASASNSARLDLLTISILREDGMEIIGYADEAIDNSAVGAEDFFDVRIAA